MKKLLLTTGVIAALAGSQMGFAACASSGVTDTSASCGSAVNLQVANVAVLKGLDDYDFSDPAAKGWNGTSAADDKAVSPGAVCIGTNNPGVGVRVSFSSAGDFQVTNSTKPPVTYDVYFNNESERLTQNKSFDIVSDGKLDNLLCTNQNYPLNVEFTGTELAKAASDAAYTDIITVTVAPLQ